MNEQVEVQVTREVRLAADRLFDRLSTTFAKTSEHFRVVSEELARHRLASQPEQPRPSQEVVEALRLWSESALMTDYDEDGNASPRDLDKLGHTEGGDIQIAAKATRKALDSLSHPTPSATLDPAGDGETHIVNGEQELHRPTPTTEGEGLADRLLPYMRGTKFAKADESALVPIDLLDDILTALRSHTGEGDALLRRCHDVIDSLDRRVRRGGQPCEFILDVDENKTPRDLLARIDAHLSRTTRDLWGVRGNYSADYSHEAVPLYRAPEQPRTYATGMRELLADFRWRADQCRTNLDAYDEKAASVWDAAAAAVEEKLC